MNWFFIFFFIFLNIINAQLVKEKSSISILGIRVSFLEDDDVFSTGNGNFLYDFENNKCGNYTIDPPPHDRNYFKSQLNALNNYFDSVSKNQFKIDLLNSEIYPLENDKSYHLDSTLATYYPYDDIIKQDLGIAKIFQQSIIKAFEKDSIKFDKYDLIVIFHAGIGQDFSLPFIDPTPSDIPSSYIDSNFLYEQLGIYQINLNEDLSVSSGIILPESQNHLLYDISDEIFIGSDKPCDYQFGLTGTFAFMVGLAIGLPPLYDFENEQSAIGSFGLMDQGSNNGRGLIPAPPNPYSRIWAGWENPKVINPSNIHEIISRDSELGEILKINISKNEYFLIENRNNWIKDFVDIDSLLIKGFSQQKINNYFEIIIDSTEVSRDNLTKVVTHVPNYDYGLPGSGILIWHIDENAIKENKLNLRSINNNIAKNGIDLEEADGAQDIGFDSQFLFVDPSLGLWSDFWFENNSQFFIANKVLQIDSVEFTNQSFPNSNANTGANSHISLTHFSKPSKIMTFKYENPYLIDEFQNFDRKMIFSYDFNDDKIEEIIGINDSIWWTSAEQFLPVSFFEFNDDFKYLITLTNVNNLPEFVIAILNDDKVNIISMTYNGVFSPLWSQTIDMSYLPVRISGNKNLSLIQLHYEDKIIEVSNDLLNEIILDKNINDGFQTINWLDAKNNIIGVVNLLKDGGIISEYDGKIYINFENIKFNTLSAIDLNLDGNIKFLSLSEKGDLYVFNKNLILQNGFPIKGNFIDNIFSMNIINDKFPEIIVKDIFGRINILDMDGRLKLTFPSDSLTSIIMIGEFMGKNSIFTDFEIFSFNESNNDQNKWNMEHGNYINNRTFEIINENLISDNFENFKKNESFVYPNPVLNGTTKFRLSIHKADKIIVNIFDISGFLIEKIEINQIFENQINEFNWNVSEIESGVYFANIEVTLDGQTDNKIVPISIIN